MPELTDIERRLRETELEMMEHRGDVKRLLSDVAAIAVKMDTIAEAAVKFGQTGAELASCRTKCDSQQGTLVDFAGRLSKVEAQVAAVAKSEEAVTSWWGRRLEKLADMVIPMVIGALVLFMVSQYTANKQVSAPAAPPAVVQPK